LATSTVCHLERWDGFNPEASSLEQFLELLCIASNDSGTSADPGTHKRESVRASSSRAPTKIDKKESRNECSQAQREQDGVTLRIETVGRNGLGSRVAAWWTPAKGQVLVVIGRHDGPPSGLLVTVGLEPDQFEAIALRQFDETKSLELAESAARSMTGRS